MPKKNKRRYRHMTRKQFRYWSSYIAEVRNLLWLGQWQVELNHKPTKESCHAAQIRLWYGRLICDIRLNKHFNTYSPEDQRHAIVHELLHVTYADIDNFVEDFKVSYNASFDGDMTFVSMLFRRVREHQIDKMSTVIAQFMPLPDVPKTKKGK